MRITFCVNGVRGRKLSSAPPVLWLQRTGGTYINDFFVFVFDCSFLSLFCDKKRKKRNQRSLLQNHHKNIYLKKIRDAIFHKIKNFGKRRQYKRTLSKQPLNFYFPNFLFATLTDNFVHKNKESVTKLKFFKFFAILHNKYYHYILKLEYFINCKYI